MRTGRRRILQKRLFKRDGWQDRDPTTGNTIWYAHCAFGCGKTLTKDTATIDHYPIPARLGGTLILSNTRLACYRCNTTDGGKAGGANQLMPPNLTRRQKIEWWREHHARNAQAS